MAKKPQKPETTNAAPKLSTEITLRLDEDNTLVLRPTLQAMRRIDREFNGIVNAIEQMRLLNFDAACTIIQVGSGNTGERGKEVPELVFRFGIANAIEPCIQYLTLLLRGGRPAPKDEEGDDNDGKKGDAGN